MYTNTLRLVLKCLLSYLLLNGLIEKHLKPSRVVFHLLYYKEELGTSPDAADASIVYPRAVTALEIRRFTDF